MHRHLWHLPQTAASNLQAVRGLKTVLADARPFRKLGDRPLVVLTARQRVNPEEFKKAGHHEFVESSHNIQFDRPEMVIKAVNEVVSIARKKYP